MLLSCTCQKLICPPNAIHKAYRPISSYAHDTTMSLKIIHMDPINQQCDQEHWYTCISHYCHMTLNKYASYIRQVQENHILQLLITITLSYICQKQISSLNATYANNFMCRYQTAMSVYMPHMNSMQSTILQVLVYIHSH